MPDNASGEVRKRAYNLIEFFMALSESVYIGTIAPITSSNNGQKLIDIDFALAIPLKSKYQESPSHDER